MKFADEFCFCFSFGFIEEAVTRLEEALVINPKKHDALWCIGNAHTSHAFLSPDHDVAILYFAKATECYKRALEEVKVFLFNFLDFV